MKYLTIIFIFVCSSYVYAQNIVPGSKPDNVPQSLLEDEEPEVVAETKEPELVPEKEEDKPEDPKGVDELKEEVESQAEAQSTVDEGISIQVEEADSQKEVIVPAGKVKIYSPWPAKPIFPAPEGWQFAPAGKDVTPYRTTARLSTGQEVHLAITPFILVPVSDGQNAIRVMEPGYQPELGYIQRDTIGFMLEKSNTELEETEKQTSESIYRLQQLLSSFPKSRTSQPQPPVRQP